MLRGKLPFDGSNKDEIIDRTLAAKLEFTNPHWQSVTDAAKDLLSHLLVKDPRHRFTPEQALAHHWFDSIRVEKNILALDLSR